MKVVILSGGFGSRLSEYTKTIPKPLVTIGNKPLIWHLMKFYSTYGFNDFIICTARYDWGRRDVIASVASPVIQICVFVLARGFVDRNVDVLGCILFESTNRVSAMRWNWLLECSKKKNYVFTKCHVCRCLRLGTLLFRAFRGLQQVTLLHFYILRRNLS